MSQKKILIVGGGTAGLISALILKKFLNAQIDVVYSKNIGIIGVGEGSTEHFREFMEFVGIDRDSLVKETDATFKAGIFFDGWTENSYVHNVGFGYNSKTGQYPVVYARQIINNKNINSKLWRENKILSTDIGPEIGHPVNQYHFNTHKLHDFLIKTANTHEIKTIQDDINEVIFKENGEIDHLVGDKQNYNYDFYIDATGFKRLLIGKMGSKWISFGQYLKMKAAIVFPTGDEDEYNILTLAKAMDYGWRFKIPTWGRHGNGYIFDSDYITADQAKKELDKEFGFDVEISKEFKFDPGHLDKVWIKNCVAIGLSGSFVEPLEATSIGTSIQQSFLLMHKILNYSEKDIEQYNKSFSSIMENIRDFIVLHYIVKKNNTSFWKDIQKINLPESLKDKLVMWEHRLPIREDFRNISGYSLFWDANFLVVMEGLGLINRHSIKKEYNMLKGEIKQIAENSTKNILDVESGHSFSHKHAILSIRNYVDRKNSNKYEL